MKKYLFILLIIICSASVSEAQIFKFGVKAGVVINQDKLTVGGVDYRSKPAGFEAGLQMQVKIPVVGIFIQPEVVYSYSATNYDLITGRIRNVNNQIDVPVMIGWKIAFFRIQAGPVFSFPYSKFSGAIAGEMGMSFKDYNTGYVAGVGFDLGRFTLDARYQGEFKAREATILGTNVPQVKLLKGRFNISLGYTIFKI